MVFGKNESLLLSGRLPEHGYIRGKLRIKKDDEQHIYIVKTLRLIDEEGAQQLRQMKADVLKKRRERRAKRLSMSLK